MTSQINFRHRDLWHAAPHDRGPGRIHILKDDESSLCGETIRAMGGWFVSEGEATCRRCLRSQESMRKREDHQREWAEAYARGQEAAERERAEWQAWYGFYLKTREWRERRDAVMDRAKRVCEGCGKRRAEHVHHLTYAHVGDEFLWELRAVCAACHKRVHAKHYKDSNHVD